MSRYGSTRSGRARIARRLVTMLAAGLVLGASVASAGSSSLAPGPQPDGTGVTPEGWRVTPAGEQTPLGSGPLAIASSPDGTMILVANAGFHDHSLMVIDPATGAVLQTIRAPGGSGYQGSSGLYAGLAFAPDGATAYASDGPGSGVRTFAITNGVVKARQDIAIHGRVYPAGIAVAPDGGRLYVAGNLADALFVVDPAKRKVVGSVATGHLPYGVALDATGSRAYVTNWGATTVSVVDTATIAVVATIEVGTHPSAVAISPTGTELYVANADSDSVSVIDTSSNSVLRTIDLRPYADAPVGASPNALAVSPDGSTLYVANAGDNDVAVVRLARPATHVGSVDEVAGLIPTAWYPDGLAMDPSGSTLFVVNMKALGVGPVATGQYIGDLLQGSLSRIAVPAPKKLAAYTRRVRANDGFDDAVRPVQPGAASAIPRRPGDATPIKHVIYVMKENRTFDQVLGDLGRGNGDPSLTIFGQVVTPNQHELARRFVTLDNFYTDGEVSADGWSWSNAAYANTYNQKNWPLDYGPYRRPYDFGGFGSDETAAFPGRDTANSFLWDRLAEAGVSYRNYGFFMNDTEIPASMPNLMGYTDTRYPGWDLRIQDQVRIDEWLREFAGFEAAASMPAMQFVYLPQDHTMGTASPHPRPTAMVADNDLALGRLVEAVSHSAFWADTAIFVVEDDAQDGPDHVDGHRTIAQVISPYTQYGMVDSTFYSTVSMLRTMELILGVGPMTQFDAAATPMWASFADVANLRPYTAITPGVSLSARNDPGAPMAAQSAALDFSRPDAADEAVLNEAIWLSARYAMSSTTSPSASGWSRPTR